MEASINRLNKVQDARDFLICEILYREANGKTNLQYDRMRDRLEKLSFANLDKKATKYIGNWRSQFGL